MRPLNGTLFLAVVLSVGVMPIVAQLRAGVSREVTLDYIVSVVVRLMGLIGLAIVAVSILFDTQIMSIFGSEYQAQGHLLELNSLVICLTFFVVLFDQTLLVTGQRVQALIGTCATFILATVLELLVIGPLGISGVIYAKMVALAVLISYQMYAVGTEIRGAIMTGFQRLLLPVGILAVTLLASGQIPTVPRAVIVL
jgi:O-antigen/teichoic acid export membrane protein